MGKRLQFIGLICLVAVLALPKGLAASVPSDLPLSEIINKAASSVVHIVAFDKAGDPVGSGTGFLIAPNRVLTNAHVVDDLYSMHVAGGKPPHRKEDKRPRLLKYDAEEDLALLEVDLSGIGFLSAADESEVLPGLPVVVYGNDYDGQYLLSEGIVRATLPEEIVISAPTHPGHSGSPVLDKEGRYIGIVARSYAQAGISNMGFAIPLRSIREFMKSPGCLRSFPAAGTSVSWYRRWKAIRGTITSAFGWLFKAGASLFSIYIKLASVIVLLYLLWKSCGFVVTTLRSRKSIASVPRPLYATLAFAVAALAFPITLFAGLVAFITMIDGSPFGDYRGILSVCLVSAFVFSVARSYYRQHRRPKKTSAKQKPDSSHNPAEASIAPAE